MKNIKSYFVSALGWSVSAISEVITIGLFTHDV